MSLVNSPLLSSRRITPCEARCYLVKPVDKTSGDAVKISLVQLNLRQENSIGSCVSVKLHDKCSSERSIRERETCTPLTTPLVGALNVRLSAVKFLLVAKI